VQFSAASAVLLLPSTFLSVVGCFRKGLALGLCIKAGLQTGFSFANDFLSVDLIDAGLGQYLTNVRFQAQLQNLNLSIWA